MGSIKKTSDLVKKILIEHPETRSDNNLLYLKVCQEKNSHFLGLPFSVVMMHMEECGFPPFESVFRARRKIQKAFPELAADETTEYFRELKEEEFKKYARMVDV